jgi:hypothetical protein
MISIIFSSSHSAAKSLSNRLYPAGLGSAKGVGSAAFYASPLLLMDVMASMDALL